MQNSLTPNPAPGWNFDNSYARLPQSFYARQNPSPVRKPGLAVLNDALAEALGLNAQALAEAESASVFAGSMVPQGAEPLAQAYAGHQFGHFTMLGDGRAILLGEHIAPDGARVDIQLKGSGQTPFSRRGDGRAALGPMLREYIISEAMHALGIPTTRSLAVATTGEPVFRDAQLPGAVLTRVAASHIRVGTFAYASAWGSEEDLKALADYTLQRHYPECREADNPYLAFLQAIMARQAALVAKWQLVGFVHGVMNTDNMAISGETIDYGPCAFMDAYDPATVFSSIDRQGRYAYGNQPTMAQWNLARFTETLLPLLQPNPEQALALGQEAIAAFPDLFRGYWLAGMRAKLGLFTPEADDLALIEALLDWMRQQQADYTNTFRVLSGEALPEGTLYRDEGFTAWYSGWKARLAVQPEALDEIQKQMRAHNPAVIPRNYRVEEALDAAVMQGNLSVMHKLLKVLEMPYNELSPEHAEYAQPPAPSDVAYQTFCGT